MPDSRGDPITVHGRRLACENRMFRVYLDHIEGASQPAIPDFLVVEPRAVAGDFVTGVAVLPVIEDAIGLLRVYRHPVRRYSWEAPRGFIDAGETPEAAAARELEEETGLRCEPAALTHLGYVSPEPGVIRARLALFAASDCTRVRAFEAGELGHAAFRLFTRAEQRDLTLQSAIEDGTTLAALHRYATLEAR